MPGDMIRLRNLIISIIFPENNQILNWENPKVRKEVFDIMKFWADQGIDGFRLDAFQFAAKDTTFPQISQWI